MQFLIGLFLVMFSLNAMASPDQPVAGQDYAVLDKPVARLGPGKNLEVVQFFMFRCPHCHAVEPTIDKWAQQKKGRVDLAQMHFSKGPQSAETKLFLTLEAMGILHQMKPVVFEAIHVHKHKFSEEAAVLEWISKQAVDVARFKQEWNSAAISDKLAKNNDLAASFGVRSVPAFVVGGRYLVSTSMIAKSNPGFGENDIQQAIVKILDHLVESPGK